MSLNEGVGHQVEGSSVPGKGWNLMNLPSEIREGSRRLRELAGIHVYEYREKAKGYANSVRFLKPRQLAKVCDSGVILCLTAMARKSITKGKTLLGERS